MPATKAPPAAAGQQKANMGHGISGPPEDIRRFSASPLARTIQRRLASQGPELAAR
jgi:hypothetical protein